MIISAKKARKITELIYHNDKNTIDKLTDREKVKVKEIEQLIIQAAQQQHYCIFLDDMNINSPILSYLRSLGYIVYAELKLDTNDYTITIRW